MHSPRVAGAIAILVVRSPASNPRRLSAHVNALTPRSCRERVHRERSLFQTLEERTPRSRRTRRLAAALAAAAAAARREGAWRA